MDQPALSELEATYNYLEENFSEREMKNLAVEIERVLQLISNNPSLFMDSNKAEIRKVPILKFNTLYYWKVNKSTVEILSFYSNRQKESIFSN